MNTMRLERFSSGFQSRCNSPSENHVHALKDISPGLVGEGEDALGTQNIRPVALHDLIDPRQENLRFDRAVEGDRHRLHFGVVQNFRRVIVMLVMAMVVVAAIRAQDSSCS